MSNFDLIRPPARPAQYNLIPPPRKRSRKWKWLILFLIILGVGIGINKVVSKTNQVFTGKGNIFTRISGLIVSPDKKLIGEEEGQVNILLMGVGGNGHEGAYLTDTMIVAQINTQTNEVILTSIPRDFSLVLPKIGFNKVNAAYAYAYRDDPSTAGDVAIAAAEKITGFTIPYYAVVDFKGFVKAVDDVGGVDVTVDQTFTDSTFPNDYPYDTKGYLAPVTFTKGPQHMSGQRALIFARSRHSNNANEGSDFARSERQKKILIAMKNKVLNLNLTNLSTINNLLSDFTDNFRTNFEPYQLKHLMDMANKITGDNIYSFSLEPQGDLVCSMLVDASTGQRIISPPKTTAPPPETTATTSPDPEPEEPKVVPMYVIVPCQGKTLTDIHEFLVNAPWLAKLKKEATVVEIQTSTGKPISPTLFKKLSDNGIDIRYVLYKGKITYDTTILYDNSHGSKPKTLDYINSNYTFTKSDVIFPSSSADLVIILGKDSL